MSSIVVARTINPACMPRITPTRPQRRILAHDPSLRLPAPAGRPLRGYRLGERLDPTFVRSFEPDVRSLASVDHPAVVGVHDAWREPGAAALVMRRMTGGTLRDRLADGPLSRAEASAVFERIDGALVADACRGLTHGNRRPGSVLFDAAGAAHLGDLDLGSGRRDHEADASAFVALLGDSCATPAHPDPPAHPREVKLLNMIDEYTARRSPGR